MATVSQLASASENTYLLRHTGAPTDLDSERGRTNNAELVPPPHGFEHVGYSYDSRNGHGAVAYYNPQSGEVIVAHRGTDFPEWNDLKADVAMTYQDKTDADKKAIEFTKSIYEKLEHEGKPISHVYQTGHSKGGHEAQHCTAEKGDRYPTTCVTFNSPGIKQSVIDKAKCTNHCNARTPGDPASAQIATGHQLGDNFNISEDKWASWNPIENHSLKTVNEVLANDPRIGNADARDFVAASREPDRDSFYNKLDELGQQRAEREASSKSASSQEAAPSPAGAQAKEQHPTNGPPRDKDQQSLSGPSGESSTAAQSAEGSAANKQDFAPQSNQTEPPKSGDGAAVEAVPQQGSRAEKEHDRVNAIQAQKQADQRHQQQNH